MFVNEDQLVFCNATDEADLYAGLINGDDIERSVSEFQRHNNNIQQVA